MHMAGGAALPPPIVLALPSESIATPAVEISELRLSPPAYFLFRTRAPPIV
jgi:hypothetical protein